jgi:hypothetical protein
MIRAFRCLLSRLSIRSSCPVLSSYFITRAGITYDLAHIIPIVRLGCLVHDTVTLLKICFLDAFAKLRKSGSAFAMSVSQSVCPPAWNKWAPTVQFFMKFVLGLFENLSRKFQFHENLTRIAGTLHEVPCAFVIISR